MRHAAVAVLLVASTTLAAQQAPAPTAFTATIRGRVVDAGTGAPLARAAVTVYLAYAGDTPSERILTDDRGGFDLPARASFIHVSKGGYATTVAAAPAGGTPMRVALPRGAAIVGRVVNDAGQPTTNALIRAVPIGAAGVTMSTPSFFTGRPDDRGEYRIGGLPPGRYTIAAVQAARVAGDVAGAARTARLQQGAPLEFNRVSEPVVVDVTAGGEVTAADVVVPAAAMSCGFATPVVDASARGSMRGRVTTDEGEPLRCGTVRLRQPGVMRQVLLTNTDGDGWFEFRGLVGGSYVVEAAEARFMARQAPVVVPEGQRLDNISLRLTRLPAITGTVVDEHGEPMQGSPVVVYQLRPVQGRLTAMRTNATFAETNDRGEYRFHGLEPGDYVVSASVEGVISGSRADRPVGYAPVFFPSSTTLANAALVTVAGGSDTAGIVLTMSPSSSGRVIGRAFSRNGMPFEGTVTLSVSYRSGSIMLEPRAARTRPDGSFVFDQVAPGEYVVQAFVRPSFSQNLLPEFGMQYVVVNGDATSEVGVRMTAGATLDGRVVVEGQAPADAPPIVPVPMPVEFDRSPVMGAGIPSVPNGQGQFLARGVTGERRFALAAGASDGWYIKSARVNGVDALTMPFDFGLEETVFRDVEVVISSGGAALDGTVIDERNRAVIDYTVVVFSTQREDWYQRSQRVKMADSGADGRFRISSLPPGDYYLVAADRLPGPAAADRWQDPALLEQLVPVAERVSVGEGERVSPRLRFLRRN